MIVNYVCPSGKHYPLEFRRFRKRDACEQAGTPFKDHTVLFQELVDWVVARDIPGTFALDCYFTHADNLNHPGKTAGVCGDLKTNRKVYFQGQELRADAVAALIPVADRKLCQRQLDLPTGNSNCR